jgi:uncharacterized membrane protein
MNSAREYGRTETIDELSKWSVGLGIVVVALFPLSIPILILTAVALIPLAVPLVAIGLLVLPVLLVRRIVRSVRGHRQRHAGPVWREPAPRGS